MTQLETTEIEIGYPKTEQPITLALRLGACKALIQAGQTAHWADGSYEHPSNGLPPTLEQKGGKITLSQDYKKWGGFFNIARPPQLQLTLNPQKPFALELEGGAGEIEYHLGGLPLTALSIKMGAGKFTFDFAEPNPQTMELLEVNIGAAGLEMTNLANANFRKMKLEGGAAGFKLDFGGQLPQDSEVQIETGLASVEISIPRSLAAKFSADVSLASVEFGEGFVKQDGLHWSPAAIAGNTPQMRFSIKGGVGSVEVKLA
jgi:hypothetical protein